jgi:hypothetical protein
MALKYWMGHISERDDFGKKIEEEFIDGKTKLGPWAIMTPATWRLKGVGGLGLGRGQRYKKTVDGRWVKVEG